MERKIIYSALVGSYDEIPKINVVSNNWEYILFTDFITKKEKVNGWKILPLQHKIEGDNTKTSRWHKLNSHLLFENCLCTIYIDTNIIINSHFIYERANELLTKKTFISATAHPFRQCIYKEAIKCLEEGKDNKTTIIKNVIFLKNENYPENNGLFETGFIFRNHKSSVLKRFNEQWWKILISLSRRDQLSFNYILWKQKIECNLFFKEHKLSFRNTHDFIFNETHKINNNFIEISFKSLQAKNEEIQNHLQEVKKIKKSISYKIFYKIEYFVKYLFRINTWIDSDKTNMS